MEAVREYLFSVTVVAVVCGILRSIPGGTGGTSELIRFACGLFLTFTILRPITQIRLNGLELIPQQFTQQADAAAALGEDYALSAIRDGIKEQTEAYILDKAAACGAEVQVKVTVSSDSMPVPEAVHISGAFSPYARNQLESILEADLGIPKEDQIWTHSPKS